MGDNKTGNNHWYDKNIPLADKLYDKHLDTLRKEGKYEIVVPKIRATHALKASISAYRDNFQH